MLSRRALLWINRVVWTLLVGAVILLGSVVSLGRYFIPSIESHQQQLVASFNRRTGLQLSIGHLRGSWQHLSPYVVVDDLRLRNPHDPQQTVLQIAHAELQFGLFRSMASGTIAISRLRGNGVHVELEEAALGHWRLAGFGGPGAMPFDRVIDFLAAIYRAELSGSTIDLHFFGGGDAHLAGQTLVLQRAGDFRRLNLELKFSPSIHSSAYQSAPLRVVLEAFGDPREVNYFSARGYAEYRGVDLTSVLPAAKAFGMDLEHGRVDGATWFELRAGGALEVRGRAEIPQLDLAGMSKLTLAPVKNIKAEFLIRDLEGKRQLWIPELTGTWHDVVLNFHQLNATVDSGQPQRVQLALRELRLSPLLEAALADENLSAHLREVLTTLAPQGVLHNVQLDLPLQPDHLDTLRLRAQLQTVSVQPWQGAPGIAGISGYIDSSLREGHIDLVGTNFSMTFPHIYREPLNFDTVRGQVGWHIESDRALIDSGPIQVQSDAGRATAQVALDLPFKHGATPLMTLQIGLQDSAAQYRDRFIPYIVQPSLLQWLQRAIGKGEVPIGGFIYRGSLLANDHPNNTVQLFLHARAAELTYQPEWPPLRDIHAAVWVDDGGLRVNAERARIYDRIALRNSEVNLQHEGDVGWLTVNANATGNNDDVLRLLRETPLRKQIGSALDHWHWSGATQSHVQLGIAISGSRPQEISVDSHLNGGTLEFTEQNILLEDVRGDLSYHSENKSDAALDHHDVGLQAKALTAKWFGKPVAINVATISDGAIAINATGSVAMLDVKQWLHQPLFDFASGEAPFAATLHIANGSTALQVDSDLQGTAIELPAPYHKPADQSLPLHLVMELSSDRQLTATLSDWADLRLRWRKTDTNTSRLNAGVVRLGQAGKTAFTDGQFIVTGAIGSTDLSEWRTSMRAHPGTTSNDTASNDIADDSDRLAIQIQEIHFDSAKVVGQTLHDLIVSGRRDSAGWTAQVRAEQIAGTFTVPDNAALPWRARLNYLRLPAPAKNANNQKLDDEEQSLIGRADPRDASAIDLRIDHLWRGDEEFGWIETQLRPVTNGLRLDNLKGQLREVKIEASEEQPSSLTWTREGENDHSEFVGRLSVDDIGKALQRWHYEPVLTSKNGHITVALQWPGRPDQFKFVQADGKATLRFDDGRFLRASGSTTGALKVVGVFNFANFLRRLQFDFSDIYKNGVSFDEMQGSLSTQRGVLTIEEPIEIKSPSSRFHLAGQIDFNNDQTDMELVATLPVASNLPWVAALTGALPAAAGLYVASKIFETQFDKFSSASYQISGPLADPQVKLRRVFDDQLPKRNDPPQKAPVTAVETAP
jgi:uncharacterized protein (TIGR02099 family)